MGFNVKSQLLETFVKQDTYYHSSWTGRMIILADINLKTGQTVCQKFNAVYKLTY